MHHYVYIILLFLAGFPLSAQTSGQAPAPAKQAPSNTVRKAASKLSKSLDEGKNDGQIAAEYEELAKTLAGNKDFAKAEEYLNRALDIYNRRRDKPGIAAASRELARVKEQRKDIPAAIRSYETASRAAASPADRMLNLNDASRLRNRSDPETQSELIRQNLLLLDKKDAGEEKSIAYRQLAETSVQMNRSGEAISNYEKALENMPGEQPEAFTIKEEMSRVYVAGGEFDKAVDLNRDVVRKAQEMKDVKSEIAGLQSLSHVYFVDNRAGKGLETLTQAYNLAIASGQTFEAKRSLELLAGRYRRNGGNGKLLELYRNFLDNLETMIRADSSLVDIKLFQATEDRIVQLEKERILKDELIRRTSRFNYVLIASIVLMLLLMALIAKAWYSIRVRNKRIALQSLRREMNPHFIFNSLNSVNRFIAQNNELEANKYLTSYSRLMRNVMENSSRDFVRLNSEIEQLREYLELEQLRFREKFACEISVDENIDAEAVYIPGMLIQPHLENAIWHGLRYRESKGLLKLGIMQAGHAIRIVIDDNGIGITASENAKTRNQKVHHSRGLTNISERIRLLNDLYGANIRLAITEKRERKQVLLLNCRLGNI